MKFQVEAYTKYDICENESLSAMRNRAFVEACSLKHIRSRTFIKICKFKPNKRKTSRSAISLAAFGFFRTHCGGRFPCYFH